MSEQLVSLSEQVKFNSDVWFIQFYNKLAVEFQLMSFESVDKPSERKRFLEWFLDLYESKTFKSITLFGKKIIEEQMQFTPNPNSFLLTPKYYQNLQIQLSLLPRLSKIIPEILTESVALIDDDNKPIHTLSPEYFHRLQKITTHKS